MVAEKGELTVQEARRILQMRTASVYSLLRDEVLQGHKNAADEWTIDAESVEQYRLRRLARRNPVRTRGRVIDVSPRAEATVPARGGENGACSNEEGLEAPAPLRVPEVHRAPGEFDELPDELSDPSVGWTENLERNRG